MKRISFLILLGLMLWQCKNNTKEKNESHSSFEENQTNKKKTAAPKYDSIRINMDGFTGYYRGPEFNEEGDIAHQFSNKAAKVIGEFLKESYRAKNYLKVHIQGIKITTQGLDQEDSVYYSLSIPFQQANPCTAHTGIEHCGSWNYQPKLFLNQRLERQKKALQTISKGKMNCKLFVTPEGFQEYWIFFKHLTYQGNCK